MIQEIFAFAIVFVLALMFFIFTVIFSKGKLTVLWALLSSILWFALGGINFIVFADTAGLLILGYVWYAVGVIVLIIGLVLSITAMADDKKGKEFEVT